MDQRLIEKFIDGYQRRCHIFPSLLLKTSYVHEKAIIQKLMEERRHSVSWFCSDAHFLLSIDFETELPFTGKLSLSKYCPQYYLLDKTMLLSYFGFRTALRNKKAPLYPNNVFITLYVMEIINGLYEKDLDEIEAHIEETFDVLLQKISKAKVKKIRISAYQNLALLREDTDSLLRYEKKIKRDLFLKGDHSVLKEVSFASLIKSLHLDKIEYINETALFVMEQCYKTILPEIFQKGFSCGGFERGIGPQCVNENKIFELSQTGLQSYGVPPLFVDFPVLHDREVFISPTSYLRVYRGVLASFQVKLTDSALYFSGYYLAVLADVVVYLMGGPKRVLVDYKKLMENDIYHRERYKVQQQDQQVILSVVKEWFKTRKYLYQSYTKSVAQVKQEMQIASFRVDAHSLDTIRTASIRTQEKLIVEEKEVIPKTVKTIPKKPPQQSVPPAIKKEPSGPVQKDCTSQSPIGRLCEALMVQLSDAELRVFQELLKGHIPQARTYCREESLLLSVVIEKINTCALKELDDVIIERNQVLCEYRDEMMQEIL